MIQTREWLRWGWQAPVTLLLLAISLIKPPYPDEQNLHHTPTVLCIVFLFWASRKQRLSPTSLACIAVFFWLHILGARWIYSFVPYDAWAQNFLGLSPNETMGWILLAVSPSIEVTRRAIQTSVALHLTIAVMLVGFLSAAYEILEWLLTLFLSPTQSQNYNGQQGDFFDAQKDMALAIAGSILTSSLVWVRGIGAEIDPQDTLV